ncbi:hypothetical protein [Hyphomicrobium sp.]|uniref:hypothetical protein n=1 Tax=Hyphomicrobium sp. TaxID=82 RepID=UPI002FDF64CF
MSWLISLLHAAVRLVFFVALAGFASLGLVFCYNWNDMHRPPVSFDAPGGKWTLTLEELKLSQTSYQKRARLSIRAGPMAGHDLICRMDQMYADRELFDSIRLTSWRDDDLKVDWVAGTPPVTGTIDIAAICSDTAVFDHRPSRTTLRFHEICLGVDCRRWIEWLDPAGEGTLVTPCRTSATGGSPVFTLPGDVRGQIDIDFDSEAKRATWISRKTGQTGVVDFATDCDT